MKHCPWQGEAGTGLSTRGIVPAHAPSPIDMARKMTPGEGEGILHTGLHFMQKASGF